MTDRSLNGWPVIHSRSDKRLVTKNVPGTKVKLTLHKDAAPLLLAIAAAVHEQVLSITANNAAGQDEAGYTYRAARGTDAWSNHASATAIDLNWRIWPMFKRRMNAKQRQACNAILKKVGDVAVWGGSWSDANADEMHWEVKRGTSAAKLSAWCKKNIGSDGRLK